LDQLDPLQIFFKKKKGLFALRDASSPAERGGRAAALH
jgi:hypothetical protein